jgi:hypothetical protein
MSKNTVHLSLLDNSHAFLREAVRKALAAQTDICEWQFAIISLVQTLELSLKAILYKMHPILIYENIDAPKHTVSPLQALGRLENPAIASVNISQNERRKIESAIALRNRVTHSDFELKAEYASAKFFEMFAFVMYFQGRHLETEIENVVSSKELDQLLAIEKSVREIAEKAERRITEEQIESEWIWECSNCGHSTFVAQDGIDTCYTCRYTETVVECSHCNNFYFGWQLESFDNELDIDICEGQAILHNSFGYSDFMACEECLEKIKEDIQNQRWDEENYYRLLEEEHYRNQDA